MATSFSDEEEEEILERIEHRKEKEESATSQLSRSQKFWMGVGVAVPLLLWNAEKIERDTAIGIAIAVIIITYWAAPPKLSGRGLNIREHIPLMEGYVREAQFAGTLPKGEAKVMYTGGERVIQGKPDYRTFKVLITDKWGLEYCFTGDIDSTFGDLKGWVERPEGFVGDEKPRVVHIFGRDVHDAKKLRDYLYGEGKKKKK